MVPVAMLGALLVVRAARAATAMVVQAGREAMRAPQVMDLMVLPAMHPTSTVARVVPAATSEAWGPVVVAARRVLEAATAKPECMVPMAPRPPLEPTGATAGRASPPPSRAVLVVTVVMVVLVAR